MLLIIYIHGGGFVAMSPSSHENNTRKQAKNLEVPLFSIDYRLSSKNEFPKALDDVFQCYMWIIKYAEKFFKIKIEDILLVGDSAGGNLFLSLTYILILKYIRLSNVIFLFYPALKMYVYIFSLSYLNCITDPILCYNLLKNFI